MGIREKEEGGGDYAKTKAKVPLFISSTLCLFNVRTRTYKLAYFGTLEDEVLQFWTALLWLYYYYSA